MTRQIMNISKIAFIAAAVVALSASRASATLVLTLSDGTTTETVIDGGGGDSCLVAGCVTFNGGINNFTVNVTTGTSYPAIGSTISPVVDLNSIQIRSNTGGTLNITLSQTGFNTAGTIPFVTNIGGTLGTGDTLVQKSYLDATDTASLLAATQIGSTLSFGPGGPFSGTSGANLLTSPTYSLIQTAELSMSGGTVASFDSDLHAVPEPASLTLFGTALLGLGWLGRRRKSV